MIKSRKIMLPLLALSVLAASQVALAVPGNVNLRMECPRINDHGTYIVTNYGSVLSGPGKERVNEGALTYPMFTGVNPGGVPLNLYTGEYTNAGTSYDASTGVITCSFASSIVSNPSFNLTYQLQNGFNGIVTSSTSEDMNLKFTMGLKS